MGLLLILAVVVLTCLGMGYAGSDVYVVCSTMEDSDPRYKIYAATDMALTFNEIYAFDHFMYGIDFDGSDVYFNDYYGEKVWKWDEMQGSTAPAEEVIKSNQKQKVDKVAIDASTSSLYYFDYAGDMYSLDLGAADPASTVQLVASPGRVRTTSLVGRDMYVTSFDGECDGWRKIKKINLDTFKVTDVMKEKNAYGMAVDASENALYFAYQPSPHNNPMFSAVGRRDLATGAVTQLLEFESRYAPKSLALFDGGILYYSWKDGLYWMTKTGQDVHAIGTGLESCQKIRDIKVVA